MKRIIILLIPTLLLSCSTGQQATRNTISVHAGLNSGGITENTDLISVGKQPDAFSGATKTSYHAGLRATQSIGIVELESGSDFMQHRQTLTYSDEKAGYNGNRRIVLNQLNVPVTIGVPLFRKQFPNTNLKLSAGYLMQFNHLFHDDLGTLPEFTLSKQSSGATLSVQANLLTAYGKPRIGLYGMLYRGSRIYTDPYNPLGSETPGSSFAAIGLKFYLFSR